MYIYITILFGPEMFFKKIKRPPNLTPLNSIQFLYILQNIGHKYILLQLWIWCIILLLYVCLKIYLNEMSQEMPGRVGLARVPRRWIYLYFSFTKPILCPSLFTSLILVFSMISNTDFVQFYNILRSGGGGLSFLFSMVHNMHIWKKNSVQAVFWLKKG